MSQVVFSSIAIPLRDYTQNQPFSFSGVKIPVAGADNIVLTAGDPLRVIYQLWEQPGSPVSLKGHNLEVSYLIGQLGVASKKEQTQSVDRSGFDLQGNLLMGTDLPTTDLHPGNYRLVIRVTDPESNESTTQAINFRLVVGEIVISCGPSPILPSPPAPIRQSIFTGAGCVPYRSSTRRPLSLI